CWAVGGYGLPVTGSTMYAQSPQAHRNGYPATSIYSLATILPRSVLHGNVLTSGLALTPAVHTNKTGRIDEPSDSSTPRSLYPDTFVSSFNCTLRSSRFFCAHLPS